MDKKKTEKAGKDFAYIYDEMEIFLRKKTPKKEWSKITPSVMAQQINNFLTIKRMEDDNKNDS